MYRSGTNIVRPFIELPDSASVIEALSNSDIYDQLASRFQQSPLRSSSIFSKSSELSTCGSSPQCPAYEGETKKINGREYKLYCHNAPWGSYFWLPTSKSLSECEEKCHQNSYDCNGLTFYPSTGACSIVYSKDAEPYIWDNGYQKIGAIPADKADTAFGPGSLCPLPGSDGQVWYFGPDNDQSYKISCLNQFQVPAANKKSIGTVKEVDECADKCWDDDKCSGFHYYQPIFPGGGANGLRSCELIMTEIQENNWTPVYKPNQYMAGLKLTGGKLKTRWTCGEEAWTQDKGCRKT